MEVPRQELSLFFLNRGRLYGWVEDLAVSFLLLPFWLDGGAMVPVSHLLVIFFETAVAVMCSFLPIRPSSASGPTSASTRFCFCRTTFVQPQLVHRGVSLKLDGFLTGFQ